MQLEARDEPVEIRAIRIARATPGPPYLISVLKHENEDGDIRGCLNPMSRYEDDDRAKMGLPGREAHRRIDGYWCADRWTKEADSLKPH